MEGSILHDSGYDVTVVCPTGVGRDLETDLELDGATVPRFPLGRAEGGFASFVVQYLTALARMAIQVIHSANPMISGNEHDRQIVIERGKPYLAAHVKAMRPQDGADCVARDKLVATNRYVDLTYA